MTQWDKNAEGQTWTSGGDRSKQIIGVIGREGEMAEMCKEDSSSLHILFQGESHMLCGR